MEINFYDLMRTKIRNSNCRYTQIRFQVLMFLDLNGCAWLRDIANE